MGMGMGVNPYPPVDMGDLTGLFFVVGYGNEIVISGGYLPIVISKHVVYIHEGVKRLACIIPPFHLEMAMGTRSSIPRREFLY
jgi:hypothetical protein